MEIKERATSILKAKSEMNSNLFKNRGTIKTEILGKKKENSDNEEEEKKIYEEKKTIPFKKMTSRRPLRLEDGDENMEEGEHSVIEEASFFNNSPKSMQSMNSVNDKRHLEFKIKKMNELIEGCCTNPLKQVEHIVELFKGVDFILNNEKLWPDIFKCDENDERSIQRLSREMDYFLYNSLILIENQEQMRTSLLSLIANMTVINYPSRESFGFKCLKALKELINNDNPLVKNLVIGTLKNVIVPLIKKPDLNKISYNILNGVNLILSSSFDKESSLFEPDLMIYGAMWVLQIKEVLLKTADPKDKDFDSAHRYFREYDKFISHDAIMNFLANITLKNNFGESLVKADGFEFSQIVTLFEHFTKWKEIRFDEEHQHEEKKLRSLMFRRTIWTLQIMVNIAPFLSDQPESKAKLQDFLRNSLEKKHIEPLLVKFYARSDGYYTGSDIKEHDENPMERIEELKTYFEQLSQLIVAYSMLFRFKDITILEFTEEALFKTCGYQVLVLTNYAKLNPLILKACSIFLLFLMKHPNLERANDTKIHNSLQNTLNDYVPLLWFIGGSNYETLCWMSTLYYKPFLTRLDEFESIEICDQRNSHIQEAFFHVVRVIKFLSNSKNQNTRGSRTAQYCMELCQKANFVKERNAALFKAWEMPNDNVRLLICRTFSCLSPVVWMLEDLRTFLDILKEMKSFSKKNCDEMIAEIFMIFSKILLFYNSSLEEIIAEAIDLCFDILLNNMERNFKDLSEMNSRKIQISVSCIFFLKRASSIKDLHNSFLTPKILFLTKKFFFFEEKYMLETMTPLILEDTWACSNIEHLLQSTSGNEQIQANTLLGFRLINRIADILQEKTNTDNDEDIDILERDFTEEEERMEEENESFCQWFQPKPSILVTRIKRHFEKILIHKMKNELSPWNQINKSNFLSNFSNAVKNAKKDDFAKNPELYEDSISFNGQQIIYRLAMFVLMKEKSFQNKNEDSYKSTLSQKIEEFKNKIHRDKLAKEKPNLYEKMNMKNPLDFDPKRLRGKELLEIVLQGAKRPPESELLALYRNQFFDVNNTLFLDQPENEVLIKNKSESPLKKRIAFDLVESFSSPSNISQLKEKSIIKPANENQTIFENYNVLNKKGVEKLIENLNNRPFEDIIGDNFTSLNIVNLNRNTILLSALFRAMYFANKKSNISESDAIKSQLNYINILRGLTKLANEIGWVNSNIGYKYLRAVKFYYTMPETSANQDPQMLHIYEIVFKSVNQMLKDIKNNCLDVNEKDLLKSEVMFLISEISHCVIVSLEQLRCIQWAKEEINIEKGHEPVRERSTQEKCFEFIVSQLFPLKNFRIIIKILLFYYKNFSDYTLIEHFDNRIIKIQNKIVQNLQRVIAVYNSICKDDKYKILSLFCELETKLNLPIRQSFLNEILQEGDKFLLLLSLERYLRKKKLFLSEHKERILHLSTCFFRTEKQAYEEEMWFLLTNRGVYVLIPQASSCSVCPKYSFCKEGPVVLIRNPLKEIENVVALEGDQRIALKVVHEKRETLYFVIFAKMACKKAVERILAKKLHIIKVKDTMYEQALNTISEINKSDIKSAFWLRLSLESNPKMVFSGLSLKRRLVFLTFSGEMLIISENFNEYSFLPPKVVGQNYENLLEKRTKPTQMKRLAIKKLLEIERKFSFKADLSKFVVENDDENMIYLKFGAQVVSLFFYCDFSREKFKQEVIQDLVLDSWKRSYKNLGLTFVKKPDFSPSKEQKKSLKPLISPSMQQRSADNTPSAGVIKNLLRPMNTKQI